MKKGNFKQKLYSFMYGRYGNDELGFFCTVLILVLVAANFVTSVAITDPVAATVTTGCLVAAYVGLATWSIFRMMSKKIYKRRRENGIFLNIVGALKRFFTFNTSRKTKSANKDDDFYIFRDCTKCSCTLRLPRKKGRNKVKCPKCAHRFYVVSKK